MKLKKSSKLAGARDSNPLEGQRDCSFPLGYWGFLYHRGQITGRLLMSLPGFGGFGQVSRWQSFLSSVRHGRGREKQVLVQLVALAPGTEKWEPSPEGDLRWGLGCFPGPSVRGKFLASLSGPGGRGFVAERPGRQECAAHTVAAEKRETYAKAGQTEFAESLSCGEGVIAGFGGDFEARAVDADLDVAIGGAGSGAGGVAESVLVAGVAGGAGVGDFDGVAGEFGEDLASGGGGGLDGDAVDSDFAGKQDLEDIAVGDAAAVFAAVADDEDDLAAGAVALAEVEGGAEDGVVEDADILGGSDVGLGAGTFDGDAVNDGALRAEWAIHDGSAIVAAAFELHLVEDGGEFLAGGGGKIGNLADGGAVGVERDLVIGAEGAGQGGVGLVDFLDGDVGHAGVEDDGGGKRERIAGEELEVLFFAVFVDAEVLGQKAIDHVTGTVFHGDGDEHEIGDDLEGVEVLPRVQLVLRDAAGRDGLDGGHGRRRGGVGTGGLRWRRGLGPSVVGAGARRRQGGGKGLHGADGGRGIGNVLRGGLGLALGRLVLGKRERGPKQPGEWRSQTKVFSDQRAQGVVLRTRQPYVTWDAQIR